jgi:hypothetical protein
MEPGIQIDAKEFAKLLIEAKAFDKNLNAAIRKKIRETGKPIVEAIKSEVLSASGKRETGLRRGIAAGVAFRINAGTTRASVTIVQSGKKIPPIEYDIKRGKRKGEHVEVDRSGMHRLFNKREGWRHPAFPRRHLLGAVRTTKWVHQNGRPYFGDVIVQHREVLAKAVVDAMEEATAALAAGK